MRNTLILAFLCLSLTISGATYYVSPTGSDVSGSGTITSPWFTLNKAWSNVSSGDIIYMRGGTYRYGTSSMSLTNKSGTSGNTIKVWAYPGEKPVLNYDNIAFSNQLIAIKITNVSYLHIKGIRVCNISQPFADIAQYGMWIDAVTNSTIEQIECDHIGGWGFCTRHNNNNILYLNCDSHHNADPNSGTYGGGNNYGGSDGWQCDSQTSTNITYRGCRAWWNSDDGWDCRLTEGNHYWENCWSFWNGYLPGTFAHGGNGEGFKVGGNRGERILKNCLVFENYLSGIQDGGDESGYVKMQLYNSVAYKNGNQGINFEYDTPATARNNISYANGTRDGEFHADWQDGANVIHDHNSFDLSVKVTDEDFVSVSSVGMDGPRQADGSLPDRNFLKLAPGSDLIDAGVDVGLAYNSKGPDLGAFETQSGSTVINPVYVSSAVENAIPNTVVITYNLNLAIVAPASTSFTVKVNSLVRTINVVTISGTKVSLTLSSPIVYGDVVTVTYTKPATNPLQTATGGQAATLSAQTVVNNVNNVVLPVYVSSAIENANPNILDMTYSSTLANIIPAASSFSVTVNSVTRIVSSVAISGNKVKLSLTGDIKYGDIVVVSYAKPSANPLQTATGGLAASITAQTATNNIINPVKDAVPVTITMKLSPNRVHKVLNVQLIYSSAPTASLSPEIIRISDLSGKLFIDKLIITGALNIKIPLNLKQGIYTVSVFANGLEMTSQKMRVY